MWCRVLPLLALYTLPVQPITTPDKQTTPPAGGRGVSKMQCAERINARLEAMHQREASTSRAGLDLRGYSLHHPLQHRGYDMYVTGMRVRVPARHGWFRVERCAYDAINKTLEARLVFKDMAVSGLVRLYDGDLVAQDTEPHPLDACNMTLRFRQAGLQLAAILSARSPPEISTRADFLEPNFVSVHGQDCARSQNIQHRADVVGAGRGGRGNTKEDQWEARDQDGRGIEPQWETRDLGAEVEDVFLRGVKTLLTSYMDKQLHPALRETLMSSMGYTVSYGR